VPTTIVPPSFAVTSISEWATLFPSPTYAIFTRRRFFFLSSTVKMSAMAWQGCSWSVSPLITGTDAASANRVQMSWPNVRIMTPPTMRSRFFATS
jgi:hypothetical protein